MTITQAIIRRAESTSDTQTVKAATSAATGTGGDSGDSTSTSNATSTATSESARRLGFILFM